MKVEITKHVYNELVSLSVEFIIYKQCCTISYLFTHSYLWYFRQ